MHKLEINTYGTGRPVEIRIVIKLKELKYKKSYLLFCIGINLVPYIKGRTQNGGVREKSVEEITFFLAKGKGIGS